MAMRVLKSIMFLEDGWHFSEVIDVRTFRGENIGSDRYLVVCKICVKQLTSIGATNLIRGEKDCWRAQVFKSWE